MYWQLEPKVEVLGRKKETIPTFIEFGDILIRYSDLMKKNVLAIRNTNHNKMKHYDDTPVSEEFKELINSMIHGKTPTEEEIKHLGKEEETYNKLIHKSGLRENLKHSNEDIIRKLIDASDKIFGEIDSGNDNPDLLTELHHNFTELKKFKVISAQQMKEKMAEATKALYSQ